MLTCVNVFILIRVCRSVCNMKASIIAKSISKVHLSLVTSVRELEGVTRKKCTLTGFTTH